MGRGLHELTALKVARLKEPGLYFDGGNLHLRVSRTGGKSWIFRYFIGQRDPATGKPVRNSKTGRVLGRNRDLGLGSFVNVSLEEARRRAAECRRLRAEDVDPLEAREEAKRRAVLEKARALKFQDAGQTYIAAHRSGWRNAVHADQWPASLEKYVYPIIGDIPVQEIDTALVMKVLRPIWSTTTETASRVRGRIEAVLDAARAQGHIAQGVANPARWRGHLDKLLPKKSKVKPVEHHPALAYAELPAFMAALRVQEGVAAKALEFTILTAARTGETIGARWSEINSREKLWIIPGSRMKSGREHRTPLSSRALDILAALNKGGDLVFQNGGEQLHRFAMLRARGRADLTVHGFRSTFRDWAAERTHFPNHVVEMALAHTIGNAVEAAYRRGDLIEQRRQLMDAWDRFCASSPAEAQVIPLNISRATTSA
jgi:integrase